MTTTREIARPFSLDVRFPDPFRRTLLEVFGPAIEKAFALSTLNDIYADVAASDDGRPFLERTLEALNVSYNISPEDLARIPRTGPVIVVSNHPFGGLDGIILARILTAIRPDAKVMANYLLSRIPDLRQHMFFVDPFGGKDAARANVRALRQSIDHVADGGMLAIFPSGTVSHINLEKRAITDPSWSDTVARIVRKTGAPVLPVFFGGCNSALFNLLGMLHPLLRTALLPRELLNKKEKTVALHVGSPIAHKRLASFETDAAMTAYLRLRTYLLHAREKPSPAKHKWTHFLGHPARQMLAPAAMEPIIDAVDPALLEGEIGALSPEQVVMDHGEFTVCTARASQVPHVMRELGRLREITFRGVSEGTGKSFDLDSFDAYYLHLFVWNRETKEIVGAYRLGPSDEILPVHGVKGFYTSTLFHYQPAVFEKLGPSLEVGRSFVRPEYQKSYSPLLLLWKGIGQFVARHPQYQVLFGPVSINNQYDSMSRQLIVSFMEANNAMPEIAAGVRAKNPPRTQRLGNVDLRECSTVVRDMEDVSDLIEEIEADQKGIPILLRQYLKLGGKILGFNIDPDFGDVLDGLILVDLRVTDVRLIQKFAGAEGAARILAGR